MNPRPRPTARPAPRPPARAACRRLGWYLPHRLAAPLGLAALALWSACAGSDPAFSADVDAGPAELTAICPADDNDAPDDALELTPGTPAEGRICPVGDEDWYVVTSPAAGSILNVTLTREAAFGAVDLRYTVYAGDARTPLGHGVDPDGADGPTRLVGAHWLAIPGRVYVVVRDDGNDEQDRLSNYAVQVDLTADLDAHEPNDAPAAATPLPPGESSTGALSYADDSDWFRFEVPAGPAALVRVELGEGQGAPTELQAALVAADGAPLGEVAAAYDDVNPAAIDVTWAAPAGTYYVVVNDRDGDEFASDATYTVRVTVLADPDAHETPLRNDGPETAQALASGDVANGIFIASRADQDWFVIAPPADTAPGRAALLHVALTSEGAPPAFDVTLALLVADPATPCVPGDACLTLAGASDCRRDADCPSHGCLAAEGRCLGGGVCLPGGCAVPRYLRTLAAADAAPELRTILPLDGPGPYYLVLRDRQDRAYDGSESLALAVELSPEPDLYEPNGAWLPGVDDDGDRASWRASLALATPLPYTIEYRNGETRVGPARPATPPDAWPATPEPAERKSGAKGDAGSAGDTDASASADVPDAGGTPDTTAPADVADAGTPHDTADAASAADSPLLDGAPDQGPVADWLPADTAPDVPSFEAEAPDTALGDVPFGDAPLAEVFDLGLDQTPADGFDLLDGALGDAGDAGGPDIVRPPPPTEIAAVRFEPVSGFISYEGDQDFYRIDIPEEIFPADGSGVVRLQLDWDLDVTYGYEGERLQVFWLLFRGEGPDVHAAWNMPAVPPSGVLGDGLSDLDGDGNVDCLYLCHFRERPLWLRVSDFGRTRSDPEVPYRFHIVLRPGCPEECACDLNCPAAD